MNKNLLLILLDNRRTAALEVQKILTEHGCLIKTRLGINDNDEDKCTNTGLVIIELLGEKEEHKQIIEKLNNISNTQAKLVNMAI